MVGARYIPVEVMTVELIICPKIDVKPLDAETARRIGRVANAETVTADDDGAMFAFAVEAADAGVVRGHLEMAARFELGAHWHTRYELTSPDR
jgi:hypothetical protein